MVNEKSSEELFHGRTEFDRKRALNRMSSLSINERSQDDLIDQEIDRQAERQTDRQTERQTERQTDSDLCPPPPKKSFFKDCRAVLDELLEKIENDRLLEPPSLTRFKEKSVGLIGAYIESASLDYNRAVERSKRRSEYMSGEVHRRLGLLTDLKHDSEDLEADLLEYLGY